MKLTFNKIVDRLPDRWKETDSSNEFAPTKFITNGGKIHNMCPICGYEFEEEDVQDKKFNCKGCDFKPLTLDQLITDNDDYAHCI